MGVSGAQSSVSGALESPIFWRLFGLDCQVEVPGAELWGVGLDLVWILTHYMSLRLQLSFFQVLFTMARRARSSRAWHFVLSAARRDTDARAVALAGNSNWGYDSDGQVGLSGKVGDNQCMGGVKRH